MCILSRYIVCNVLNSVFLSFNIRLLNAQQTVMFFIIRRDRRLGFSKVGTLCSEIWKT